MLLTLHVSNPSVNRISVMKTSVPVINDLPLTTTHCVKRGMPFQLSKKGDQDARVFIKVFK